MIAGNVRATQATVHGTVSGEIEVEGLLDIHSTGRVDGSLAYGQIAVAAGGEVSGNIFGTEADAGGQSTYPDRQRQHDQHRFVGERQRAGRVAQARSTTPTSQLRLPLRAGLAGIRRPNGIVHRGEADCWRSSISLGGSSDGITPPTSSFPRRCTTVGETPTPRFVRHSYHPLRHAREGGDPSEHPQTGRFLLLAWVPPARE